MQEVKRVRREKMVMVYKLFLKLYRYCTMMLRTCRQWEAVDSEKIRWMVRRQPCVADIAAWMLNPLNPLNTTLYFISTYLPQLLFRTFTHGWLTTQILPTRALKLLCLRAQPNRRLCPLSKRNTTQVL